MGGVHYAFEVRFVHEVVNPMQITSLPRTSPTIVGVSAYRGLVVPVLDLRIRFGFPPEITRKTKWIMLKPAGSLVGIVVDSVEGVFSVSEKDVRPAPDVGYDDDKQHLIGVTSRADQLVFLVDGMFLLELAEPAMAALEPLLTSHRDLKGLPI